MLSLDLFDSRYERDLREGAVDDLEARRIDDLNDRMQDLLARAKEPAYQANPRALAALKQQFQQVKDERDSYYKVREAGIPGNVPVEKIPGKEELLRGRGRSYYEGAEDYAGIYSPEAIALGKRFCEHYNITDDGDVQLAVEIIDSYLDEYKATGEPVDLKRIKSGVADAFRQVYRGMGPGPTFRKKFKETQKKNSESVYEHGGGIGPRQHWQNMMPETALNPQDPQGDYEAKRRALHDLSLNKDVDQATVLQRRLDLDRKAKGIAETVVDVKSGMARIYRRLAPKIEHYKDSFLAGQLYDELENYAELHGAEREFKQMMNGARNRAHMEYDTNPGGFQNWFWFLPFEDNDVAEGTDDIKKRMSKLEALALVANRAGDDAKCKMYQQKIQSLKQKLSQSMSEGLGDSPVAGAITRRIMSQHLDLLKQYGPELVGSAVDDVADYVGDVDEIGSSDVSGWVAQVERMLRDNPPEAFREGWSDAIVARRTGQPRTPYSVYIKGRKWKDFENDDHAEAVANKLRAKFKADGRDPGVITIAPTDMSEEEQKPGFGEFPPKQEITIVPPKKLKSGETYQDRNKYWQSQGQAPIYKTNEDQDTSGVEQAILKRIMVAHLDLLRQYGPEKVMQAAEEVAYNVGDVDEIGTSDVSAYVQQVKQILGAVA
jgi:hypothetical protein